MRIFAVVLPTLAALAAMFAPVPARAACAVSVGPLIFGTYAGTAATPGVTPITLTCLQGESWNLGLNGGTGVGSSDTHRLMTGTGGMELLYGLYLDAARTINWGDTTRPGNATGSGTGTAQTIQVYGNIAAGQFAVPGSYTDTISMNTTSYSATSGGLNVVSMFNITATIVPTCTLSAVSLAFGIYAGAILQGASSLSVTCTNTTTYSIGLSVGSFVGATETTRRMTGAGGGQLGYALFSDAGRTLNWGATSNVVAGTGTGTTQSIPVYGQIPAGQFVAPGSYSDTIIATLTY